MTGRPLQGSFLSPESKPLAGLREVNRRVIWAYVEAARPGWEVTFDIDAQDLRQLCASHIAHVS
ncbi:MAG: hypothetical protein AAGB97_07840 [Dehalococcoidia bacterium]|nr:hypothetical protein [Chloroflexota bacterium]MBT9159243.1 hypothetical protein [Chloroflexota bacterium]MBT9161656.1 hypothetical protein [Chloroflexota bacterium]